MTEQPTTPEPSPSRARRDGLVWSKVAAELGREPYAPPARTRPAAGWPKTGDVGASTTLGADEEPATVPARPYGEPRFATGGLIRPAGSADSDVIPFVPTGCLHRHGPPPASELRAIAADLNAHGGIDETFVAGLLQAAVNDMPTPSPSTMKPVTYETIMEAMGKFGPLPLTPPEPIKLTREQADSLPKSPPRMPGQPDPAFFGTPVELVETVEESTPYQLTAKPDGIIEIDTDLTEAEYARLRNDWLHAVERGPQTITRVVPFGEPFRPLADVLDEQPPTAPRPWWRRTLDRVRRWVR